MERWTVEKMESMSAIEFAIAILNERKNKLNMYTPLAQKITKSIHKLQDIQDDGLIKRA